MATLQERLTNAKAGIKSSEWPATQMSKQPSIEERLKKAREDAAKKRASHQNVQSVENIWDRHDGTYENSQPLTQISSGSSSAPKPLTGFAAGVQANNEGYMARALKKAGLPTYTVPNYTSQIEQAEALASTGAPSAPPSSTNYKVEEGGNLFEKFGNLMNTANKARTDVLMQQAEKPSFGNYVWRKAVGGGADTIEGVANAAGYWQQAIQKSGEIQANNALRHAAATAEEPETKKYMESYLKAQGISPQQAGEVAHRPTQAYANFGDNYVAKTEEKYGDADFGFVGNLMGDVAQGVGGMLVRMPARFVPGLGEVITFASAYGNAKQSAQKNGADEQSASLYALGTATVELATEKMFGFVGSLGGGAADNALTWFVNKVAKSEAGKAALNTILGALGEGAEEFIAEYGQAYIDKLTIKMDERSLQEVNQDAWYNALVSGITSVLFGTADIIRGGNGKLPTAEDLESVTIQAAEETVNAIARGDSVALREMVAESKEARNKRLENASIKITAAQKGSGEHFDKSMLSGVRKQDAGKYLAPILRKLGIFTKYQNTALDVSFEYSGNGLRRSAAHQEIEGGNEYSDFALVNANLKELCENAYPAEAHLDEKPPTADGHVQAAATLFSVLQDGERLIPVKITVKFFGHQDPTLHIVIAGAQTENKSANVNAVAAQISGQHIADGTLTKMSVSDFLGIVNESEQFTKRMPNFGIGSADGESTLLHAANPESKEQSLTDRLLYTEALMRKAQREGNIYAERILKAQIEKAQRNSRKTELEASTQMPTIYADYMRERNMSQEPEETTASGEGFDEQNVNLENDANSDTMFAGAITDCFDRKVGIASAEEDLIEVNPNYATKSYEWSNNCQRCVPAYEMRRRGFKVVARPLPGMASYDYLANDYTLAWKNRQKILCKNGNGLQQIKEQMSKWGNGARAEVYVAWNDGLMNGVSHVFVAEQRNGRTVFLDPQSSSFDCEYYFDNVIIGKTNFLRIDNNIPSDYILDCCTNMR